MPSPSILAALVAWALFSAWVAKRAFSRPTYRQIARQEHLVQQLEEAYENHPFENYRVRLEQEQARLEQMRAAAG